MTVAAVAALAAGCGNYSTEDIKFLSALPRGVDLRVAVETGSAAPAGALSTALYSATCPPVATLGDATVWQWARPTSEGLNRGVDFVVGLIDVVRKYPPTARHEDSRRWGPFDADDHPGRELQILMDRSFPDGADGPPAWSYRFQARVKGTGVWTDVIAGSFHGPSSARGDGTVTLDFDAFYAVGINDSTTPQGTMAIDYHRSTDPVTIDLTLTAGTTGGFGVQSFAYGYAGWADGFGTFDYAFRNAGSDLLEVQTSYDAAHAGRLQVRFTPAGAPAPAGSFRQCWDASACLVYVDDPLNLSCAAAPCSDTSDPGACVAVKAGTEPFVP